MSDSSKADAQLSSLLPYGANCWNRIGTSGDRSCPELEQHVHCRNCPVFASAARVFFDRPAPEGYLAEWTQWLASTEQHTRHTIRRGPRRERSRSRRRADLPAR